MWWCGEELGAVFNVGCMVMGWWFVQQEQRQRVKLTANEKRSIKLQSAVLPLSGFCSAKKTVQLIFSLRYCCCCVCPVCWYFLSEVHLVGCYILLHCSRRVCCVVVVCRVVSEYFFDVFFTDFLPISVTVVPKTDCLYFFVCWT